MIEGEFFKKSGSANKIRRTNYLVGMPTKNDAFCTNGYEKKILLLTFDKYTHPIVLPRVVLYISLVYKYIKKWYYVLISFATSKGQ